MVSAGRSEVLPALPCAAEGTQAMIPGSILREGDTAEQDGVYFLGAPMETTCGKIKMTPSERAAIAISDNPSFRTDPRAIPELAAIIDRETGVGEMVKALEDIATAWKSSASVLRFIAAAALAKARGER